MKDSFAKAFKTVTTQRSSAGFTLIELLVAMSLTVFVISSTGYGLITIMTTNSKEEAKTQRRTEINRALDFISDEVRMAMRINRIAGTTAGTTVSTVVTNAGLTTANLGSTGTIVLYLQIPITGVIPIKCPVGGPNADAAPPSPSSYDQVVYDIRTDSSSTWLDPRVINRYGRTPKIDGTINPCSTPTSKTFIDAISGTNINPPCVTPAVLSGTEGFYACVNDRQADIFLRSKVSATKNEDVSTKAFSRIPQLP